MSGALRWRVAATFAALALGGSLALTGCSETVADRESGAGSVADSYEDASQVRLFRNADSVPNVAFFCLDGWGFASTLSGGDSGKDKAASLLRFPEYDPICADGGSEPGDLHSGDTSPEGSSSPGGGH